MTEKNNRLSLHLYPDPGVPSNPPVWDDVERLALHYPAAHDAVTMVHRGDWTRERALVALTFALARAYSQLFRAEVERRMMEPPRPFVINED